VDRKEALQLLEAKLDEYRRLSYAEATAKVGSEDVVEVNGPSGATYRIEVQLVWDRKPHGDVRVLGAVDDGGWRAFVPLTVDVLIRRDQAEVE
jgi:hypothetical protein